MTASLTAPRFAFASSPNRQLLAITLILVLATLPLLAAHALDARMFQGDNLWLKPLKFHLSLAIYTGTLTLFAMLLPEGTFTTRRWQVWIGIGIACILAEVLWIGSAASLATASHFNRLGLWSAIYPVMGAVAVTLTGLSLSMAPAFWRRRGDPMMLAIALGLVLTFALTVLVAGTMSSLPAHTIGTPVTGARMPIFGWSTEVGDLRIAHFLATHAMHAVPLAGLSGRRDMVWGVATLWTALVLWCFARALEGLPPM
jgi:hypothetical protein